MIVDSDREIQQAGVNRHDRIARSHRADLAPAPKYTHPDHCRLAVLQRKRRPLATFDQPHLVFVFHTSIWCVYSHCPQLQVGQGRVAYIWSTMGTYDRDGSIDHTR
jgi:hypothetical protein